MNLPSPVDRGSPISAHGINQLAIANRNRAVATSPNGMLLQQRPNGTVINHRSRGLQPAPARYINAHPFRVLNASKSSGDDAGAYVRVLFGQVNSVTPTIDVDGSDIALDATLAIPLLEVETGLVFLKLTLDEDGYVDTVEVLNDTDLPEDTETEGHITLATITVLSPGGGEPDRVTAINQSVTRSLQHMVCGDKHIWGGL